MSKILIILFLVFSFFNLVNANSEIKIISRSEWGADESFRYLDSPEWKGIIKKWQNTPKKELTEYQKKFAAKKAIQVKNANSLLVDNYLDLIGISKTVRFDKGHKLAWPISYSKKKYAIVVHHTHSEYKDSYKGVRSIYRYHTLSRQWGDIGYNYLIGYNGEIFEGRAGGFYSVGAHDKWNNQGTVGIALIGDYDKKNASVKQLESLKKLVNFLQKKYDIDFTEKKPFFKRCIKGDCVKNPLYVNNIYPLIGHRDAGHTSCPGDELYKSIINIRNDLSKNGQIKSKLQKLREKALKKKYTRFIKKIESNKRLNILIKVEEYLDKFGNDVKFRKTKIKLELIKQVIISLENENLEEKKTKLSFEKTKTIKVKLSYPEEKFISLSLNGKYTYDKKDLKQEKIYYFKDSDKYNSLKFNFILDGNKLYFENKEIINFSEQKFLRIKSPNNGFLTIDSWDRKPSWDKSGKYNDNKFRGDIVLYLRDKKLVVVNELFLSDYLKGLGEVSDSTNPEKIKTIITLARTYAIWYTTKARKFAGEWFDASDDPDVFQKYLGYSLEKRSPKVNEIVDSTQDMIVTYNGDLIKTWYHSSSDGKTLNFNDYCKNATGVPDCMYPEKFPFLIGVSDPGGKGKIKAGHGIGVPGTGVEYLSDKGWTFNMIIKYFLPGTEIKTFNL